MGPWFDTGRTMEYTHTGTLTIHPEYVLAAGISSYIRAGGNWGIVLDYSWGVGGWLTSPSGTVSAPDTDPITLTYTVVIRTREQARYETAAGTHTPTTALELREVLEPAPGGGGGGYVYREWAVAGYPALSGNDYWSAGPPADSQVLPDADLRYEILSCVCDGTVNFAGQGEMVMSARSGAAGMLVDDRTDPNVPWSSNFLTNGVDVYGGLGSPSGAYGVSNSMGPLTTINTSITVQKWDQPYPGAVVHTPFYEEDGVTEIDYTADVSGVAGGAVSGRVRRIREQGVDTEEDTTPTQWLPPGGLAYTLQHQWMMDEAEFHYEERENLLGQKYVVKGFDDAILATDRGIKDSFTAFVLTKANTLAITPCDDFSDWTGGTAVTLSDDAADKREGAASLKAVVAAVGTKWIERALTDLLCRHYRYLEFDIKGPGASATLEIAGANTAFNPGCMDDLTWTRTAEPIQEETAAAGSYTIPLAVTNTPTVSVSALAGDWWHVIVDLSVLTPPGLGCLMDTISSVKLTLTEGTWHVDAVELAVNGAAIPSQWWAVDQFMRPRDPALWTWYDIEVSGSDVTAKFHGDACLIGETNGIRCLAGRSVIRRENPPEPIGDGAISYTAAMIDDAIAQLKGQFQQGAPAVDRGWSMAESAAPANYAWADLWAALLTYQFQEAGPVTVACLPRYTSISGIYPREWTFEGTKVLQGACDGILYTDGTPPQAREDTKVRFSRTGDADCEALTDEIGYYLVSPIKLSNLVSALPEDDPANPPISVDTRWDLAILTAGDELLYEETAALFSVNRMLERFSKAVEAAYRWILMVHPAPTDKIAVHGAVNKLVVGRKTL